MLWLDARVRLLLFLADSVVSRYQGSTDIKLWYYNALLGLEICRNYYIDLVME